MSKKRLYAKKAKNNKIIAKERIALLFDEAQRSFDKDSKLSDRYVELARRISMKFNVSLESSQKRRFCKRCNSFIVPGINSRVRVRKGIILYCCNKCRNFNRFGYK